MILSKLKWIIFYFTGLTLKEIKAELDEVHDTSAPVLAAVYNWVNEFKRGRTSTKDDHRSGRPVEVTIPEMIDKIHDMVLNDRRIKVREIVEATGNFGTYPSQSLRVSALIHNCGRNMDTPLHSRDKGTVKIVGFWRRTCSEEGKVMATVFWVACEII